MALISIRYIGSTSSGRMHKYEIIPTVTPEVTDSKGKVVTPASDNLAEILKALKDDKVELNSNIGDKHFLSPTHLHLTPTKEDECTVDVKAFKEVDGRTVNYFSGIDKEAQRAFSKAKVVRVAVQDFAQIQRSLDSAGIEASTKDFMEYQLLEAELQIKRMTFQKMNATV